MVMLIVGLGSWACCYKRCFHVLLELRRAVYMRLLAYGQLLGSQEFGFVLNERIRRPMR